jgi:uncharacterized protein YcgI (DUF1989 family)
MSTTKEILTSMNIIRPRSGVAFVLKQGERLRIMDIEGEQVSDLICFNLHDPREVLSSWRTIDYASTIFLEMFRKLYGDTNPHRGCFGNLAAALAEFGIAPDAIPVCFNVFMHVTVNPDTGRIEVRPPKSRAGDYVVLEARMDLIVGLTACSAGMTNNFSYKPMGYQVY